jgi:tryptophanyl-tRNA synthetase
MVNREVVRTCASGSHRNITYDPATRPEVANLLFLISLCTGEAPDAVATRIADSGGGALKKALTEALNETLAPIRARRSELSKDADEIVRRTLRAGCGEANRVGELTLRETRAAMNMDYGL